MTNGNNEPRAFIIDDDVVKPFGSTKSRAKFAEIEYSPAIESQPVVVVPRTRNEAKSRKFRWLTVMASAISALAMMGIGLWFTNLIEAYFLKSAVLGWIAVTLVSVAVLSAGAIIIREAWGLFRLQKIENLQDTAARAMNLNDKSAGQIAISGFSDLLGSRSDVQLAFQEFTRQQTEFMDANDRMRLADRILFQPLDARAHDIISRQARRVTLLTTLTPAAGLDILFVLALNLSMLREISALYGGRPSTLSTLRLSRMIVTHLAVAGGLALSDTLIQQLIGRGLLGRLSARFGEGAVNGILTTRVGLAAKAVCRPIPSDSSTRNELVSILKKVVSTNSGPGSNATE